jgi:mannose/cellobiose epimerase-like protein (N-acyl-D-glucosamine 2-epimerase family)
LDLGASEVLLGAALAAEGIASSELYIQKVIRIMDLQTNGAATAAEWRLKAKQWRTLYDSGLGDPGDAFDWAELVYDPFSRRERIIKQALRDVT